MKVLIVIGNRSIGGAQRVAMHLYNWLNCKSNCSALIVSLKSTAGKTYDMTNLNCIDLDNNHTIKQLIKVFKNIKPDLVISMGVPMVIYTVPACKITGVKHIISERNDPAHFAGKKYIKLLSRLLMKLGDGFVFQTNDAKKFYGLKNNATVIPNPISDNCVSFPLYVGTRKKTIVTAGRLVSQKNHILLIKSFIEVVKKHPDYRLIIWGEGPDRDKLESFISDNDLINKVILPGATDQLFEELYDEGLFVLSSDFEGMPNALMEAMALGLPCISTDCPCGGPKDLIVNGENGLLVPVNNIKALTDAILSFVENKDLADKCANNSLKIRGTHNLDIVCQRWFEFFSLISGV